MTTDVHANVPPENHVKVLDNQGWIGLVNSMGSEVDIVNAARVSFGKLRTEMNDRDKDLLKYLVENRHTSPLEHIQFTFIVHCPLFVRGQWHRHRTWKYNEISRRYTSVDIEFYTPKQVRGQAETNRQASIASEDPTWQTENSTLIENFNNQGLELYNQLLENGVCREQARGVLPQNLMTTFWATVDLHNLIHFLQLRDSEHAQWEIRAYAKGIKKLIKEQFPTVAEVCNW